MKQSVKWDSWLVVNDGVMGGLSQSRTEATKADTLVFSGNVSLKNNGGFASVRHNADPFKINQGEGILLRVRGDGKKYQLRLRNTNGWDGMAYKADFQTQENEWQEFRFTWADFTATYRGRWIQDAPPLESSGIRQIGFLIADKQEGAFSLEVETIKAF